MSVGNNILDILSENRANKSLKTLLYHQHRRMVWKNTQSLNFTVTACTYFPKPKVFKHGNQHEYMLYMLRSSFLALVVKLTEVVTYCRLSCILHTHTNVCAHKIPDKCTNKHTHTHTVTHTHIQSNTHTQQCAHMQHIPGTLTTNLSLQAVIWSHPGWQGSPPQSRSADCSPLPHPLLCQTCRWPQTRRSACCWSPPLHPGKMVSSLSWRPVFVGGEHCHHQWLFHATGCGCGCMWVF